MTNEQINVAIAEECGWKFVDAMAIRPDGWRMHSAINNTSAGFCPNYCNDLNAMHDVEINYDWSNDCSRLDYVNMIEKTMDFKYDATLFATARQRAEAFLRAIGKWVD